MGIKGLILIKAYFVIEHEEGILVLLSLSLSLSLYIYICIYKHYIIGDSIH